MVNFIPTANPLRQRASVVLPSANQRYHGLAGGLLGEAAKAQPGRAIGVTSSSAGEGVTNAVANLALTTATLSADPILAINAAVDGDKFERLLALEPAAGLAEVLAGQQPLARCIQPSGRKNLAVLGRGQTDACFQASAWAALLEEAKSVFPLVLLDLPPVAKLASQMTTFEHLDGVLLVVESERARQRAVLRAKSSLERMGIEPLGVILNKRKNYVPNWLYNKV